jgi:hypothetical protein
MDVGDMANEGDPGLVHVHICIHCGYVRRREDLRDREISSGILRCPKCDLDGPLNIEIRDSPTG